MVQIVIIAGTVLLFQPLIYFTVCGAVSVSEDLSKQARNEIIYRACKFMKWNHVVGWISVISGSIFVFLGLFVLLYSTPIASYSETEYDVVEMAKDLSLLIEENNNYEISYHDLDRYNPEKKISISYFKYLDKYIIYCYGLSSFDLSDAGIRDISSKYKKGAN